MASERQVVLALLLAFLVFAVGSTGSPVHLTTATSFGA